MQTKKIIINAFTKDMGKPSLKLKLWYMIYGGLQSQFKSKQQEAEGDRETILIIIFLF